MSTPDLAPVLPATLTLGPVHLTVTDLDRSVEWYQRALGLHVHRHEATEADLGDGETSVLTLVEDAQARHPGRHADHVRFGHAAVEETAGRAHLVVLKQAVADVAAQQDWYVGRGEVQQRVDINQAVDNSFAEFALNALGPYTP